MNILHTKKGSLFILLYIAFATIHPLPPPRPYRTFEKKTALSQSRAAVCQSTLVQEL